MKDNLIEAVVIANQNLSKYGLAPFTWGNVSVIDRETNLVAIKPSGVEYVRLTPESIVVLDLSGNVVRGTYKPSVDTPTHLELYRRFKDIGSIVHTHSKHATIHAQAKVPIKCFGTTHADYFFGEVPVTRDLTDDEINNEYELNTGKVIAETFEKLDLNPLYCPACLVASHGPFVFGRTAEESVHNAVVLEIIAEMNLHTISLKNGFPDFNKKLLDFHHSRKHGKNAYYGQQK